MNYPYWLESDLRSDHAGETGAVAIYRGILAVTRNVEVRRFAYRHVETERKHLALMENLLPCDRASKLLPIWRISGFMLGAVPALLGPSAVFATIEAVETFVDYHYAAQIQKLSADTNWSEVCKTLEQCRQDEIMHRDEARTLRAGRSGTLTRLWSRMIGAGSAVAVSIARRV